MPISLTVRGLRELDWRLRMMLARLDAELPDAVQTLGMTIAKEARHEIGREHSAWPSLAARTVREKRRHGWAGRISETDPLLRTGRMRSSIRSESGALIAEVRADGPALFQEKGTSRMPARPFLRPAMRDSAPMVRRILAEALRVAIEES